MTPGQVSIRGAGGKGGGGGQELPDSIRSTQTADVLDLLSEGEVEGLTFGLRSIFLDGVPLQNADNTFNFEGVQVQVTPGTQGQAAIAGADGVLNEVGVGVAVVAATPVVRSITNPALTSVRVTIEVQQLTRQDSGSGDLGGSSFEWAIDLQSNGGGFVQVMTDVVEGKTASRYTRSKAFALTGSAPWDVRVRRLSADSTTQQEVNAFRWASYTEVHALKLRYPNSALCRVRVGAQQFNRIPVRAYDLMGLRIRVPTNYNPLTKVYTGVWDGTFKIAWTDCPAWIFYDLVTHSRYGLGRYFQTTPALKWQMYAIGRYCDEMVPDGKGGQEPRFKCGVYLTTREQAYKVVTDMAAVFRGMVYWAGTDLGAVQDAPQDPVALFTNANVVAGRFAYTGASHSKRHSQVVVWFNSMQEFGKLTAEVVVDRALQKRYGVRSLELSPLGIWSRGQAQRLGKWVLYSEQREGEAVSFRVGLDGALVAPGKVFQIADANEAGERLGGRVRSATAAAVTLDKAVTLAPGEAYTLSVMLQDPANPARLVAQARPVTTGAGSAQLLTVLPAFTAAPIEAAVWLLQSSAVQATSWRCLGVSEVDGENQYEITAIRHEPQKYALIEQGTAFEVPQVSRIKRVPAAPATLNYTETVYALGQERRSKATISWPTPAQGLAYLVSWRLANGPWVEMPATTENCVEIDALAPGLLDVSVKSRNALGAVSPPKTGSFTVQGNQVVVGPNLIDPSWWAPGAAWQWGLNEDPTGESAIVWADGPRGSAQALWRATAAGTPFVSADGGWSDGPSEGGTSPKNLARIDANRTYRFSLPVKRISGFGAIYWGPGYFGDTSVCDLNTVGVNTNPYFNAQDLTTGKWFLIVGYVFPAGSTGVPATAGGVFDMATGERIRDVINYCWAAGATKTRTRAFQFYNSTGAVTHFAPPAVELVNGMDGAWQAGPRGLPGASSITLVTSGNCTTPGPDRIRKVAGPILPGSGGWDSDCRSLESFVNGAWCSWQCEQNNANLMVGLNGDPAASADYQNLDYAWFCSEGQVHIYESGNYVLTHGTYSTNSVFAVHYDGAFVRYTVDGAQVRQVAAAAGLRLYLDSSFQAVGAEVRNVRFGPAGTAGANGTPGSNAQLLTLLASAQAFTFDGAGQPVPMTQTITLTALLANISGTATITATGYAANGATLGALVLGGTGNSRTLALSNFGASAFAVVQASGGGFTDQITIVRLRDGTPGSNGQNSVVGYLTNESHTVSTLADGSGGSYSSAGGDFKVFDGLTEVNSGVAFSVVATSGITGMAIGIDGVYSLTGMTTDAGTATLRAVLGAVTIDKVYSISRSKTGARGDSGSSVFLATAYIQAASQPVAPSGGSFDFSTSTLTPPSGYTAARPASGANATYAVFYSFTTATPGATVTAAAWSTPELIAPGVPTAYLVVPGPYATSFAATGTPTVCVAGVRFRVGGTIARKASGTSNVYNDAQSWYVGGTPGVYWIRFVPRTQSGGTLGGATSVWQSMASDRTVTLTATGNSVAEALVDWQIADDSAGLDVRAAGVIELNAEST